MGFKPLAAVWMLPCSGLVWEASEIRNSGGPCCRDLNSLKLRVEEKLPPRRSKVFHMPRCEDYTPVFVCLYVIKPAFHTEVGLCWDLDPHYKDSETRPLILHRARLLGVILKF